jgi:hypothetical protein
MTIERPMFPPRAESVDSFSLQPAVGQPESENLTGDSPSAFENVDLASNVIKFPFGVSRAVPARKRQAMPATEIIPDDQPKAGSTTAGNGRLRKERKEVWRMAEAATRYWRLRIDFQSAVSWAQRMEIPEGHFHPSDPEESDRMSMVKKWRAALVKQLLTPAWDTASVKWKQMALARGQHLYSDVKPERIERAIVDDLAFLAAHPVRRSNSEAWARQREFKEAMRQRIRDIAASRDLSDEEIKPVLTLKHHEIANFTEKHGVNIEWLLEGKGRIFEKDPIRLGPNSTGAELAAVVRTLPEAKQQMIEATVDRLLKERNQ